MIHPDQIKSETKKKEDEIFKFRRYLKEHVDEDEFFYVYIKNYLRTMIAANAEIVARCAGEAFRWKILTKMRNT